nr:hypothetical protein [Paludibacteraceae bacterium]
MKKIFTKKMTILFASVLFSGATALATVNIEANGSYTQNFDGIGTAATATLPTGWKADKQTSVRTVGTYAAGVSATERQDGNNMSTSAGNGIYNFGAGDKATATDRAVGGLSSGSKSTSVNFYVKLTNNGITPITSFTISYDIEQYRAGNNGADGTIGEGFSFQMYYSDNDQTYTSAGSDFLTSFAADATTAGYESAPGNSKSVLSKTLNQPLAVGESIYLAWNYSVTSGTYTSYSQALGLDNVSIIANAATGIANITNNATVVANNGSIVVTATEGAEIEVYTTAGQKIASAIATGNQDIIAVSAKG